MRLPVVSKVLLMASGACLGLAASGAPDIFPEVHWLERGMIYFAGFLIGIATAAEIRPQRPQATTPNARP
jgi:hypothetical protein